jgi:hypothetical protein
MMDMIIDIFGVRLTPALPALFLLAGTICWLIWFTVNEGKGEEEEKLTPTEHQFMTEHERIHALLRKWADEIDDEEKDQ